MSDFMLPHHRRFIGMSSLLFLLATALTGCAQSSVRTAADPSTAVIAPTVSSIFGIQPTITPKPDREPTLTPILPATNPTVIAQATIAALDTDQLKEVIIYDDKLSPDWSLEHSFQTSIDTNSRGLTYKGRYAIKAQPQISTGILYFTLKNTPSAVFRRSQVQAVRFYLSGGTEIISNEELAVAVVGSNAYPYWVMNDKSVKIDGRVTDDKPVFSESRLVFLGVNTAIPRRTYAEVTIWLDSLLYDPMYTYVTGFYLKTDKLSVPTFYVDQVSLLLTPDRH